MAQSVCRPDIGEEHLIGKELVGMFSALKDWDETEQPLDMPLGKRIYLMQANPDERLIYLTDVTEWRQFLNKRTGTNRSCSAFCTWIIWRT